MRNDGEGGTTMCKEAASTLCCDTKMVFVEALTTGFTANDLFRMFVSVFLCSSQFRPLLFSANLHISKNN